MHYDVCYMKSPEKVNGRLLASVWAKIGAAYPTARGGISLRLDALPLHFSDWSGRLMLFPHDGPEVGGLVMAAAIDEEIMNGGDGT